jgi:hypothetical protein
MTKALVLSGGGSVGIAWQTGLATGLARHGVDLSAADLIVGTSAGSAVGAQLALGGDAEERFDRYKQIETSTAPPASSNGAPDPSMAERMAKLMEVAEIEIGIFKSGRQAYGFDDIAIVPSRRTRDPEDVDISWEIDAYRFDLPLLGAAMDGVISPPPPSSWASWAASASSTSRGCGPATRTHPALRRDPRARRRQGHRPHAADVPGADHPRAGHGAHPPDEGGRHHDGRLGHPPAHRVAGPGHPGRRARPPGHPGDRRLGRARVQDRPSRSTSSASSASSTSR